MSPITFSCHCGALSLRVPQKPEFINICQCSNCRKHGVGWAYYEIPDVSFLTPQPAAGGTQGTMDAGLGLKGVKEYAWREKIRKYCFCEECGCMVFSWPTDKEPVTTVGVNANCVDEVDDLKFVEKRITYEDLLER